MHNKVEKIWPYILLATLVHVIVLLGFVLNYHHEVKQVSLGVKNLHINVYVSSYQVKENKNNQRIHKKTLLPKQQHNQLKTLALRPSHGVLHNDNLQKKAIMQRENSSSHLSQGQKRRLLEALHDAIAAKQLYPANARLMNEEGKVLLQFKLTANGLIKQIKIVKSSGYDLLDKAAIHTLKEIAPFNLAHKYLKKTEVFEIAIVYKE